MDSARVEIRARRVVNVCFWLSGVASAVAAVAVAANGAAIVQVLGLVCVAVLCWRITRCRIIITAERLAWVGLFRWGHVERCDIVRFDSVVCGRHGNARRTVLISRDGERRLPPLIADHWPDHAVALQDAFEAWLRTGRFAIDERFGRGARTAVRVTTRAGS